MEGFEGSKALHLWIGISRLAPDGRQDNMHDSREGAWRVAALAIGEIRQLKLPLGDSLAEVASEGE
jgi:hypothetical protein